MDEVLVMLDGAGIDAPRPVTADYSPRPVAADYAPSDLAMPSDAHGKVIGLGLMLFLALLLCLTIGWVVS